MVWLCVTPKASVAAHHGEFVTVAEITVVRCCVTELHEAPAGSLDSVTARYLHFILPV